MWVEAKGLRYVHYNDPSEYLNRPKNHIQWAPYNGNFDSIAGWQGLVLFDVNSFTTVFFKYMAFAAWRTGRLVDGEPAPLTLAQKVPFFFPVPVGYGFPHMFYGRTKSRYAALVIGGSAVMVLWETLTHKVMKVVPSRTVWHIHRLLLLFFTAPFIMLIVRGTTIFVDSDPLVMRRWVATILITDLVFGSTLRVVLRNLDTGTTVPTAPFASAAFAVVSIGYCKKQIVMAIDDNVLLLALAFIVFALEYFFRTTTVQR